MCGVEISGLPCLDSGHNSNLTSEDMYNLWLQGMSVNDKNEPAPKNIPFPKQIPLTQLEYDSSWKPEEIICPRRLKHLHNINSDFNNYSCEEAMKMKKLDF